MPKKTEQDPEYDHLPTKIKKGDVFRLRGVTVTVQDVRRNKKDDPHSAKIVVYQYETPKVV